MSRRRSDVLRDGAVPVFQGAVWRIEMSQDHSPERYVDQLSFIEQLKEEIRGGAGLVPFIGSGCSADSGILMGKQFTDYLGYTVWRCLRGDAWDLRESGWPPDPNQMDIGAARSWALHKFRGIAKDCGLNIFPNTEDRITGTTRQSPVDSYRQLHEPVVPPFLRARGMTEPEIGAARQVLALWPEKVTRGGLPRPNRSPTSTEAIEERAIRSLHDWRATLQFLSELRVLEREEDGQQIRRNVLTEPDSSIIDSFNVHITRGRRPNPVHYMLSHMREAARMRIILTTNFDTMIEDAFHAHHQRIDVVPVSVHGSLPHPDLVHSRDTLVKLHGELVETRADFSLDCDPKLEECRKFFHYVRGCEPGDKRGFLPSQLLVAGYSGSDARCVQLLKFVLDTDPHARIFWVCHARHDVEFVDKLFPRSEYGARMLVTVAARFDLLLLELYQRVRLHMPAGGDNFPLNHEVPPTSSGPELPPTPAALKIHADVREKALKGATGGVFWVEGPSGVLPALRDAADMLTAEDGLSAVWLELEDCGSTAAVAHHLFQAIANRRGLFQLSHALLCPKRFASNDPNSAKVDHEEWLDHIRQLVKHMGIEPHRWLIVLYARNGPGGCTGWEEGNFWQQSEYDKFDQLLKALAETKFVVLYAPYNAQRKKQDISHRNLLLKLLRENLQPLAWSRKTIIAEYKFPRTHDDVTATKIGLDTFLEPSTQETNFKNVIEALLSQGIAVGGRSDREVRDRHSFLFGLTLFRQSRPYSALLTEGIISCPSRFNVEAQDNDYQRSTDLETEWLEKYLKAPRAFLRKPGGFLWLYRDVRHGVRALLLAAQHSSSTSGHAHAGLWRRDETVSRAHYHIAEWYERAFLVSGHAGTLTEAAFHFYSAAVKAKDYSAATEKTPHLHDRGAHRWLVSVCELIRLLRVGRASVRFWMEHAQRLNWFHVDRAREVCDRLAAAASRIWLATPALEPSWRLLTARLLDMLRCELAWLGTEAQPAARIAQALSVLGPELGQHSVPDRFCASVTSALDTREPDWWSDPNVGPPKDSASFDLLRSLKERGDKEPKNVLREWGQAWFGDYLTNPIRASFWVQELVEVAYICLRRATLDERLTSLRTPDDAELRRTLREEHGADWVKVCVLASAALQAASWTPPGQDEFVMRMRSKAETIYGLALAHLHRFREAHRRFNHAHALAVRAGSGGLHVMLGILELRRAEAYLIEAEVVGELQAKIAHAKLAHAKGATLCKADAHLAKQLDIDARKNNRCAALRDDAWCAAERAESLLAGRTHGSGWWVRLRTLQLWCLAMPAQGSNVRPLTERVRHSAAHVADRLFSEGLAAFPDDWHNRLRLVDYYLKAGAALNCCQAVAETVRDALGEQKMSTWQESLLSDRTRQYRDRILSRVNLLAPPSVHRA